MDTISESDGINLAIDAILNARLALLCGAGLSRAAPSSLPTAADVAQAAKAKYDAFYGSARDPLPVDISEQAEFFFARGELATQYLTTYVDRHAFAGQPNPGHEAVADLLLAHGIETAVSTNVDRLIELAGELQHGDIGAGIDVAAMSQLPAGVAPLLKVHGCWTIDRAHTVWAPGQVTSEPTASRLSDSANWITTRLLNCDLLIVGYYTDWAYLNSALERSLGAVHPARVIVVDPTDGAWLATKAPALNALGGRAQSAFLHVQQSGAVFLDRLRQSFAASFVRQALRGAAAAYQLRHGTAPDPASLEPVIGDNLTLWLIRRDLEGALPGRPVSRREPYDEPMVGLTILELRARGATPSGSAWLLDGKTIRVLRTANQLLHLIQAAFVGETPPIVTTDIVIAVGADSSPLPTSIVRGRMPGSIVRPGTGRWLTRSDAVTEFAL